MAFVRLFGPNGRKGFFLMNSKHEHVSPVKKLVLSAMFLALGLVLLYGTDTGSRLHAFADAHPGAAVRHDRGRSMGTAGRVYMPSATLGAVFHAASLPGRRFHGV